MSSAFTLPPPESFVSPMAWGVDTHVVERFVQAGVAPEKISMTKDAFYCPGTTYRHVPARLWPDMNAFGAAEENGRAEELHRPLVEPVKSQNRSEKGGTFIRATFLRVSVSV